MCDAAGTAGTVQKTAAELRKLAVEHPDYYSRKNVERVCGATDWAPAPAWAFAISQLKKRKRQHQPADKFDQLERRYPR
jgi:hypothetical protein